MFEISAEEFVARGIEALERERAQKIEELQRFLAFWRDQHTKEPAVFPATLDSENWTMEIELWRTKYVAGDDDSDSSARA